jgi:hypothetical protein
VDFLTGISIKYNYIRNEQSIYEYDIVFNNNNHDNNDNDNNNNADDDDDNDDDDNNNDVNDKEKNSCITMYSRSFD